MIPAATAEHYRDARSRAGVALPNLVVIGTMKCGTSALHTYLDRHPGIAMAAPKELNFFVGGESADGGWHAGNWHRGVDWYRGWFPADALIRGEASPAYTSPSFPGAADRMAALIPDARLVYLVRDPIDRALSQYRHHRRDGTERRSLDAAVLDRDSQYMARSQYYARLRPYLRHFARERIFVVLQEDLRTPCAATMAALYRFLGLDSSVAGARPDTRATVSRQRLERTVERRFAAEVADDVAELQDFLGRDLSEWRAY